MPFDAALIAVVGALGQPPDGLVVRNMLTMWSRVVPQR